jgi:predicted aspartyl protease
MILGVFRDHFARVTLSLPGSAEPFTVEFILDTGFDGDLALPSNILRQLDARPLFYRYAHWGMAHCWSVPSINSIWIGMKNRGRLR